MKTIDLNSPLIDNAIKETVKKAVAEFDRGDYHNSLNDFLSVYSQESNPPGLQFSISTCLFKQNKKRQARLFAVKELLDYPDNKMASSFLAQQFERINGRTVVRSFNNTTRPESYPDISLVMIVKNEEKDLARCLESYKDIVKEMIVVDTGSTDRTVEIAKSFGARVEFFDWCNDFAKARNESLKYATCEWMLRTDADEYIEESEKTKLLHCVNSGAAEIYICPTASKTKTGESRVENVRLIKNHLGIQYDFPIHETVAISAIKLGFTQCITNIEFKHTGYEFTEEGVETGKIQRNIRVCDSYLAEHPEDYFVRIVRGLFKNIIQEKYEGLKDIETAMQNIPDDAPPIKYLGLAYITLMHEYVLQNREIDLYNVLLDTQIDFFNFSCMMQYVAQLYLFSRGDVKKANKILNWVCKTYLQRMTFEDVLPHNRFNHPESLQMLAETYVLLGNNDKAKKLFSEAKKVGEKDSSFRDKVSGNEDFTAVDYEAMKADEIRRFAFETRQKGQWQNATRCILRAASKSELTCDDLLFAASCQIPQGTVRYAQFLLDAARVKDPNSHQLSYLESSLAVKEGKIEKALDKAVEAFINEPGNTSFQDNVEHIASLQKMSPVQALKVTGKKWMDQGRTKEGLFALIMYLKFSPEDDEIKKVLAKYS